MSEGLWSSLIQDYAVYATALGALISALIFLYKKAIKPMIRAVASYYKTIEKIDRIFHEVTPNDGESIKDKVDNIDRELTLVQQRQRAVSADTKAAIFETDSNGDCTFVNRTYTRTVGRDVYELLGHGWQNAIASDERDKVVTEWYKSVEENREFSMELNFETPIGERIPVKVRSYKMVNSKGELIGYYGTCKIL